MSAPYQAPFVRSSATSGAAAAGADQSATRTRERVYLVIALAPEGATDDDVQDVLGMNGNTQRPRRRELQKLLRIRDSGRTRATRSGYQATVWVKS